MIITAAAGALPPGQVSWIPLNLPPATSTNFNSAFHQLPLLPPPTSVRIPGVCLSKGQTAVGYFITRNVPVYVSDVSAWLVLDYASVRVFFAFCSS